MRIDSGAQSLQFIQAQQAFRSRRPAAEAIETEQTASASPSLEAASPTVSGTAMPSLPVKEIQQIAQQAGFVGISAADIQRAYLSGESLLSDYRV